MMMKCLALAFLGLASLAFAEDKTLTCNGSGTASDTQMTNGQEYNYKTHSFDKSTSSSTTVRKPFTGTATVELSQSTVRIKLPPDMVPPLSDGRDAWYTLSDAFVGDKEITGGVKFNMFNKPKVKIDRMTGQLSVAGQFAEFNGNCIAVDRNAGPKF